VKGCVFHSCLLGDGLEATQEMTYTPAFGADFFTYFEGWNTKLGVYFSIITDTKRLWPFVSDCK
jgi:hypothetical protein